MATVNTTVNKDPISASEWTKKQIDLITNLNSKPIVGSVRTKLKKRNKGKASESIKDLPLTNNETITKEIIVETKDQEIEDDLISKIIKEIFPYMIFFSFIIYITHALMNVFTLFTFLCLFLFFLFILGWKNRIPHYLKNLYTAELSIQSLVLCVPKLFAFFGNFIYHDNTHSEPVMGNRINLPFTNKNKKEA
jgi:hypothetical protein